MKHTNVYDLPDSILVWLSLTDSLDVEEVIRYFLDNKRLTTIQQCIKDYNERN